MQNENLTEKRVSGELIYDGKVVHLWRDEIELPDGRPSVREVVRHVGAVAVLPLTENGEVLCVRQYRYPFAEVLLEIPAGKLDSPDENIVEAARRELREETGAVGGELIPLGTLYPSVAIFDEKIHMFAAVGFELGETDRDEDEFMEVERIPLSELVDMVMAGEIRDAKTQTAVLKVARLVERSKIKIDGVKQ
ncbi:MAG: NUDIX hydrolase [Clostridia bacterium]|nr:NUDIX hydrolase [Clostridia bacterium]